MITKHTPALAVHNLRNRIAATKAQSGHVTHVDVPIHDAETLLKERDSLIAVLENVKGYLEVRRADGPTYRWVCTILASAKGA